MLTVARDEQRTPEPKRPRGRPRKRPIEEVDLENQDEAIETSSIASNVNLEQNVSRRTRSRREV